MTCFAEHRLFLKQTLVLPMLFFSCRFSGCFLRTHAKRLRLLSDHCNSSPSLPPKKTAAADVSLPFKHRPFATRLEGHLARRARLRSSGTSAQRCRWTHELCDPIRAGGAVVPFTPTGSGHLGRVEMWRRRGEQQPTGGECSCEWSDSGIGVLRSLEMEDVS